MPQTKVVIGVRHISPEVSIIDIQGEMTLFAERRLMEAYEEAALSTTRTILLNFGELEYMNSGGIGLLIALLRCVYRQKQRLLSYGLSDHYQHIFMLTRLNSVIHVYENEADALAAVK